MMPIVELVAGVFGDGGTLVEDISLHLPSNFSSQDRQRFGLEDLASIELELREGECNDAVIHLCDTINYKIVMRDTQRRDAQGVTQNTRSVRWLNSVEAKRDARVAILSLLDLSESPDHPPLKDEDTYAKNSLAPRELGDEKHIDSWVWRYGQLKGLDDDGKAQFLVEGEY
ncbi:hypothetical protein PM082_024893 [Marasmius tenuissimus]|nr:hypothetical protein PM082_024893 [Marasmius tenuissimus]